ncbi:MAG TPA: signal recognition particle receptor subunit alpha, partial [Candidatus Galloscillospira excrementipullorum]|nr:signal recognition particle receptor subunit alpha [Candidatus Galloscillospira excrementipullorum]
MGLFEKLKQGLSKTRDSLGKAVDGVLSTFTRIDDDLFDELEEVLLQADLGLDATEEILEQLKDEVKQQRV